MRKPSMMFVGLVITLMTSVVLAQGGQGSGNRGAHSKPADRPADREMQNNHDRQEQAARKKDQAKEQPKQQAKAQDRVMQQEPKKAQQGMPSETQQQQRNEIQTRSVYGSALMSEQERNEYQERLRLIDSDEERGKFVAGHREEMQLRAEAAGVDLDDPEPEEAE
jgi:flagellar biosynthesis GTPase FlhF